MNSILAFLKKKDLYLGIARYLLGLRMIAYALSKILRTQFVILPFALWQRPLESVSGKNIAWAFLGYSDWFQILLGFLELIPALLLLFRRTTLAGAILMLPVTLNIYLINMALNLWEGTKNLSLVLLLLNCLILVFECRRIGAILWIVVGRLKLRFAPWEILINVLLVGCACFLSLNQLLAYRSQRNFLTGDWLNHHPNEWTLISESIGGSLQKPKELKAYYGAYGSYTELIDTTYEQNGINYELDEHKHQLNFTTGNHQKISYTYSFTKDSLLQMDRVIDTGRHEILRQLYKRRIINAR
ncbi:hypothetical protein A0256_23925 [Mucilaginibacter sp. PAMC 26640]|nr:hypothetical protein A0256_23925 [Mucilaginibacter sp. PAMC 26640]